MSHVKKQGRLERKETLSEDEIQIEDFRKEKTQTLVNIPQSDGKKNNNNCALLTII